MDNLTQKQRSRCMSRIKRKDTKAEIIFRKALWENGIRGYRIDVNLPGRPDIYFSKLKLAIFIDGCYWHKCPQCFSEPKSNKKYWIPKIERNAERDKLNEKKLKENNIFVIRYWEHDVKKNLNKIINDFLAVYKSLSKQKKFREK